MRVLLPDCKIYICRVTTISLDLRWAGKLQYYEEKLRGAGPGLSMYV